MLALLAASIITTITPNPNWPGAYVAETFEMPAAPSFLNQTDRLVDQQFANNPNLQREAFDFQALQDKYPVRPVMPLQTRPLEDQVAFDQAQTIQQAQQVNLQQQKLQNQTLQAHYDYTQKMSQQAEQAIPALGQLDPQAPDYPAQRAAFIKAYPLGTQSPAVQRLLDPLDAQHARLTANQTSLDNHNLASARAMLSSAPDLLNQFEELNTRVGGVKDPLMFASSLMKEREQTTLADQLKAAGYTNIDQYRVDHEDPTSDLNPVLARSALARAADIQKQNDALTQKQAYEAAYANRPPTRRDYDATLRDIIALSKEAAPSEAQKALMEQRIIDANEYLTGQGKPPMKNPFEDEDKPSSVKDPSASGTFDNLGAYKAKAGGLPEGKIFNQNGHRFKVTNGVPTLIQ